MKGAAGSRLAKAAPPVALSFLLAGRGGVLAAPLAAALAATALLLLPAVIEAVRGRTRRPLLGKLDGAVLVFLAVYALSGVLGAYPGAAVPALALAVLAALVFRASAALAMDPLDARWQAVALVAIAAISALLGICRSLFAGGPALEPATWPLVNHDHLASLLGAALPLSLALALDRGGVSLPANVPVGAARASAAVIAVGLAFTVSRAGIAAAVIPASLALLPTLLRRMRLEGALARAVPAAGLLAVVAVGAGIAFGPLASRLGSQTLAVSASERAELMVESFATFTHRPWLGWGAGGFRTSFLAFRGPGLPYRVDHAHCDLLELSIEAGAAGVIAFLGAAFFWVRAIARGRRPDNPLWPLSAACALGVLSAGIHGLADFPLHVPAVAIEVAWLAGLAVGMAGIRRAGQREFGPLREPVPLARSLRLTVSGLTAAVAVMSVVAVLQAAGARAAGTPAATRLSPWNAGVWRAAADAARERGRAGDPGSLLLASSLYAQALARNPFDPAAAVGLAQMALLEGRGDDAVADFALAVAADPANPAWRLAQAEGLFAAHREEQALATLQALDSPRALEMAWEIDPAAISRAVPHTADALARLAEFLRGKGEAAAARQAIEEAATLDPPRFSAAAADAAEAAGAASASRRWLDRGVAGGCADAVRAPLFVRRSRAKASAGDASGALADARCARSLQPEGLEAWLTEAEALALSDEPAARVLWRKTADHFPDEPAPLLALARDLDAHGDWDGALAAAREAEARQTCGGQGALAADALLEKRGLADTARIRLEELQARCPGAAIFSEALTRLSAH